MLRIERVGKRLLAFRNFRQKPIAEFYDLTDFIVNSPEEFFGEIGEEIFLLGAHARLGKSAAAVDLLGVDQSGAGVAAVVEATSEEPALSRAITAASRLASWDPPQFFEKLPEPRRRALRGFLGSSIAELNQRQRVFIIGEKADADLMSAAAWLDRRGVDIVFLEAALGVEPHTGIEFLQCRAFNPHEKLESRDAEDDVTFQPAAPEKASAPVEELDVDTESAPEPNWAELEAAEEEIRAAAEAEEPQPEPEPEPEPAPPERRSTERERLSSDRVIEVEYAGRRLGAHLTDQSPVGVALEMNSPLPIGSSVVVLGHTDPTSGAKASDRKGRVRYCRFEDQGFRLGIAFEQTAASSA